jgi:peroxiredoxin
MSRRGQWLLAGGIAGALVIILGLAVAFAPSAVRIGGEAPTFRAVNIASSDSVDLSAYRGHVTVLNLWATWCTPCEAEMPEFQRLYDELGKEGLKVVAVAQDVGTTESVREWVAKRNLTFDVLHDQKQVAQALYQANGLPETFVLDTAGRIVKRITGHILKWDDATQKNLLRRLLKRDAGT